MFSQQLDRAERSRTKFEVPTIVPSGTDERIMTMQARADYLDRRRSAHNREDWKPMPTVGLSVREIRIHEDGEYRVLYLAKLADAVYVLHVFSKKTRKTAKSAQPGKRSLPCRYRRA